MFELRELSIDDGDDVYDMLREIGPGENGYGNTAYGIDRGDFPKYLHELADMSEGIGFDPSVFVPQTIYWLYVDSRPTGVVKLRHFLNAQLRKSGGHIGFCIRPSDRGKGFGKKLLELTLLKAREKGIFDALLTCDPANLGSRGVIEHNGGKLESIDDGRCMYWIRMIMHRHSIHWQPTVL